MNPSDQEKKKTTIKKKQFSCMCRSKKTFTIFKPQIVKYTDCKSVTPLIHGYGCYAEFLPGGGRITLCSLSQGGDRDPVSDGGLWGSVNLSEFSSPLSLPASYMAVGPLDPNPRNRVVIHPCVLNPLPGLSSLSLEMVKQIKECQHCQDTRGAWFHRTLQLHLQRRVQRCAMKRFNSSTT